jgi:hypothetical protein
MMQTRSNEEEKGVSDPEPDPDPGPRPHTHHNHNLSSKSLLKPCTQSKRRRTNNQTPKPPANKACR